MQTHRMQIEAELRHMMGMGGRNFTAGTESR